MANIVNTLLLNDFVRLNQCNKDCIDLLDYIDKNYPNAVKKENNKIIEINIEIDIQESRFTNLICESIIFKEKVNFYDCIVEYKVSFKNCTFEKQATFSNSVFESKVYFDNCIFKDYVDFHESNFMDITSFYGVKLKKVPNFSACYFREQKAVNLVNVDSNSLDFNKVKKFIDDNYRDKTYNKDIKQNLNKQNEIEQKHQLRYAQNTKDSFRVIKDILIEQNNILEAQEWHKFELYAKENELTIKLRKATNQTYKSSAKQTTNTELQSEVSSKSIADKILFSLECASNFFGFLVYSTCKIFVISLVFLFSSISYIINLLLFGFFIIFNATKIIFLLFPESKILQLTRNIKHKILKLNRYGKDMIDYTDFVNYALLHIYRNTSDHHTNFIKILNFTIGMVALYGAISYLFHFCFSFLINNSIIPFLPFVFFVFALFIFSLFFIYHNDYILYQFSILLFYFWGIGFTFSMFLPRYILPIEMLFLYIVFILLCYYIFICKIRLIVFITRLISYLYLFYIIVGHTQLLNPLVGIFSPDKFFESQFEQKLNTLNSNTIIQLANISQQEFIPQDKCCEYDISFTELKSAKAIILSNKYNITAIKDENLIKVKDILGNSLYDEIATSIKQDKILGDIIKSTSTIYVIILLLCIFSLQKTARKNSIIPS